ERLPAARLRVAGKVPISDMPVWMAAADALILTSHSEGSPNVIKEAMAAELPAVATPVGDVPERLRGVPGCYVRRPDPKALGAALVALLDHDDCLRADFLERMVAIYDAERATGRRVGIVGCDARLYGPEVLEEETWGERLGWYDEVGLDTLIRQNTIFARALFS